MPPTRARIPLATSATTWPSEVGVSTSQVTDEAAEKFADTFGGVVHVREYCRASAPVNSYEPDEFAGHDRRVEGHPGDPPPHPSELSRTASGAVELQWTDSVPCEVAVEASVKDSVAEGGVGTPESSLVTSCVFEGGGRTTSAARAPPPTRTNATPIPTIHGRTPARRRLETK